MWPRNDANLCLMQGDQHAVILINEIIAPCILVQICMHCWKENADDVCLMQGNQYAIVLMDENMAVVNGTTVCFLIGH
jgi:hypothetical protein